jgi:hypothetical protein
MIRQSSAASRPNRLAKRKASPFSKQSLAHAFRVMAPTPGCAHTCECRSRHLCRRRHLANGKVVEMVLKPMLASA